MVCPNCRMYTPDRSLRCSHCGAAIPASPPANALGQAGSLLRERPSFFRPWMAILLGLVALLAYLAYSRLSRSPAANEFLPGGEFAVAAHLQKGKTNIVDFYSDYCPPCRRMSPLLARLAQKRPDVAVIKVDINRKGVTGIDWSSPVARQYKLNAIPYFQIYDGGGNLLHEGQAATVQVLRLLAQAGIEM